ncbi:hypothetical protein ABTN22_18920, partial [Acinetobacter baumannii]
MSSIAWQPRILLRVAMLALALVLTPVMAHAQDCGRDGAGFQAWLNRFKARAGQYGISDRTLARAL